MLSATSNLNSHAVKELAKMLADRLVETYSAVPGALPWKIESFFHPEMNIGVNAESLDSGCSGALLFLLTFYRQFPEQTYLELIDQGLKAVVQYCKSNRTNNYSLYTGRAGVAYVLLERYLLNPEPWLLREALEMIRPANQVFLHSDYTSDYLYDGRSGTLLLLLELFQVSDEPFLLQYICDFTRILVFNCRMAKKGMYWTKREDAWHVLADVRRLGLSPSAAEFIGRNAIGLTNAYLGGNALLANENADAHLLIGVEGGIGVREEMGVIVRKLKERTVSSRIVIADSPETRTEVGRLRRSIGDAMKAGKLAYRDVDICVPFSLLFRYLKETEAIGDRYKLSLITFGHALDGNLHVMVGVDSKQSGSDSPFRRSLQEIYSFALENGGVISGEHGIGLLQREFLGIQFPGNQLSLMKRIKELLDPNGILNPGKSFA
jgi:hypothetical protein